MDDSDRILDGELPAGTYDVTALSDGLVVFESADDVILVDAVEPDPDCD